MAQINFGEILEAAEQLSIEEREDLIRILQNRLREQKRADVVKDVREAQQEFERGECQPVTLEQLMKEILS
ncbi:hypothetical protein [Myxosarcina sp. GI1]|uniref:hypothetical protein n=1 Tax=Myxosarcina sp. GI1 TaxID=1541065 RepID=UPI000565DF5F|nr:hypothetical protein [Myxosarcina sp. GI1]